MPTLALANHPKVKVADVQKMRVPPRLSLTGIVTNKSEFNLIAAVNGYLTFIREPGELVQKGEVIAQLDASLLELEVKELTARIKRQRIHIDFFTKELQRLTTLNKTQSVSQSARDEVIYQQDLAKNEMQILENQLSRAKIQLSRTRLVAPSTGVLSERQRREGEYIESGDLLGHFLAKYDLEGQARVPVRYANLLQPGQKIQISDAIQDIDANIEAIIPKVEERSQTMLVRFSISDEMKEHWRTGQQLKIRIPSMQENALLIPRDALLVEANRTFVMLVPAETQQLQKVEINVGYGEGDLLAVSPKQQGALQAGDKIVIRGERLLAEGTQVNIEEL